MSDQLQRDVVALQNAKVGKNPQPWDYWMAACSYARQEQEVMLQRVNCLAGYIEYMMKNPRASWPPELPEVIAECNEFLKKEGMK